jgi:hypothetical protein
MKDALKKHDYLLELTKSTFEGELEPIGMELLQKLEQFASFTKEMYRSFSIKSGFVNTYGEKEWRIEIKANKGRQRFAIKEQQVVLHMLLRIEEVLANMPDISSEKKLQRQIFKLAKPYYEHCITIKQDFKISRFEDFLVDYIDGQYNQLVLTRSFEKWYHNQRH